MCIVTHMPSSTLPPSLGSDMEFKVAGIGVGTARGKFNPALHPRDSKGRFIETGGLARAGLGGIGKVIRVKGDGKIEIQFANGVSRDYPHEQITMVKRPNGAKPTKSLRKVAGEDGNREAHPDRGHGLDLEDRNPDLAIPDVDPQDEDDDNPDDEDPDPPPFLAQKVNPNELLLSRKKTKDGKTGFIEKDNKVVGAVVRRKDGKFQVLDHKGRPVAVASDWEKGRIVLARHIEKQNRDWDAHEREHAPENPLAPKPPVAAPNPAPAPDVTPGVPDAPENAPEPQVDTPDVVDPAVRQQIADRVAKMSDDDLNRTSLDDGEGMGTARDLAIAEKARRNQERASRPVTDGQGNEKPAPSSWNESYANDVDAAVPTFKPENQDDARELAKALRDDRMDDARALAKSLQEREGSGVDMPTRIEKAMARVVGRIGADRTDRRVAAKRAEDSRPKPEAPEAEAPKVDEVPNTPTPDTEKAPNQASMTRATRNQHGLKHGDEAWVADKIGTVRKGRIRVENGTTSFHPHDERVEPHEIGKGQAKFRAQKVDKSDGPDNTVDKTPKPREDAPHEPAGEDRADVLEDVPAKPVRDDQRPDEVLSEPSRPSGRTGSDDSADSADNSGRRDTESGDRGTSGADSGGEGNRVARSSDASSGEGDTGDAGGGDAAGVAGRPATEARERTEPRRVKKTPVAEEAFVASSQKDLAPAGARAKLKANLDAIRALKGMQADGRGATKDEQKVLARWSGWGSLPKVFDEDDPTYAKERDELKHLLTPTEYSNARGNVKNAHYTDHALVKAMWAGLGKLGFTQGDVLEAGSGSGNFIGAAPKGVHMTGVELDPITAGISEQLHPQADIYNESFGKSPFRDNVFDGMIGNVPFGSFQVYDPKHNRGGHSIHNHFMIKGIHELKPGGVMAVITSSFTLDGQDERARREMFKDADLIGAVRLPEGTHQDAAGTGVVTDMLMFRKRKPGETPGDDSWLKASPAVDKAGNPVTGLSRKGEAPSQQNINDYFTKHPDDMLGEVKSGGYNGLKVVGDGDTNKKFEARIDALTAAANKAGKGFNPDPTEPGREVAKRDSGSNREGRIVYAGKHMVERGGKVKKRVSEDRFETIEYGQRVPFEVPSTQAPEFKSLLGLRDLYEGLQETEREAVGDDDPTMDAARNALRNAYRKHVSAHGPITRTIPTVDPDGEEGSKYPPVMGKFRQDENSAVVFGLEKGFDRETNKGIEADVLSKRQLDPSRKAADHSDDPGDAVALAAERPDGVTVENLASILKMSPAEAREAVRGHVFEEPGTGRLVPRAEYLSDNVRAKLAAAKDAAANNPELADNVAALEEKLPKQAELGDVPLKLGGAHISPDIVTEFAKHLMGRSNGVEVTHSKLSGWQVKTPQAKYGRNSVLENETWGTPRMPFYKLLEKSLRGQHHIIRVNDKQEDGSSVYNPKASAEAAEKAREIIAEFEDFIWANPRIADNLTSAYTEKHRSLVPRTYDDSAERAMPGMSAEIKLKKHQNDAITRAVNEPAVMLDHEVGLGKTYTLTGIAMELKRMGLIKKPVLTVPKSLLGQWAREYRELYPDAKILAADSDTIKGAGGRKRFAAMVANNDWDVVILPHGTFASIPISPEAEERYLAKELEKYDAAKAAAVARGETKQTVKKIETAKATLLAKIQARIAKRKDEDGITFESLGLDYIMVDEAHTHKNLDFPTNMQGVQSPDGSGLARDMHMKLELLRDMKKDETSPRVAAFATGTPISNSLAEMYTMTMMLRPDLLEEAGIADFDSWAAVFASVSAKTEQDTAAGGWVEKVRLRGFTDGLGDALRIWRTFTDTKTADQVGLERPKVKGGARTIHVSQPNDGQLAALESYKERVATMPKGKPKPGEDTHVAVIGDGRRAAIDARLQSDRGLRNSGIDRDDDGEPSEKIQEAASEILRIYQERKNDKFKVKHDSDEDSPNLGALQAVMIDSDAPKPGKRSSYQMLKDLLVAGGIPAKEIGFIQEAAGSAEKKDKMQEDARQGRLSVIMGGTPTLGTGTNIQNRLYALHHIDGDWKPSSIAQREGRALRQGNQYPEIELHAYVTEKTHDVKTWDMISYKQAALDAIARGDYDMKAIEFADDVDPLTDYDTIVGAGSGDPLLVDRRDLKPILDKLRASERSHRRSVDRARGQMDDAELKTGILEKRRDILQKALGNRQNISGDKWSLGVKGQGYGADTTQFADKKQAATALAAKLDSVIEDMYVGDSEPTGNGYGYQDLGSIGGFGIRAAIWKPRGQATRIKLSLWDSNGAKYGNGSKLPMEDINVSESDRKNMDGVLIRLGNRVNGIENGIATHEQGLSNVREEYAAAAGNKDRKFRYADDLADAERQSLLLDKILTKNVEEGESLDMLKEEYDEVKKRADSAGAREKAERIAAAKAKAAERENAPAVLPTVEEAEDAADELSTEVAAEKERRKTDGVGGGTTSAPDVTETDASNVDETDDSDGPDTRPKPDLSADTTNTAEPEDEATPEDLDTPDPTKEWAPDPDPENPTVGDDVDSDLREAGDPDAAGTQVDAPEPESTDDDPSDTVESADETRVSVPPENMPSMDTDTLTRDPDVDAPDLEDSDIPDTSGDTPNVDADETNTPDTDTPNDAPEVDSDAPNDEDRVSVPPEDLPRVEDDTATPDQDETNTPDAATVTPEELAAEQGDTDAPNADVDTNGPDDVPEAGVPAAVPDDAPNLDDRDSDGSTSSDAATSGSADVDSGNDSDERERRNRANGSVEDEDNRYRRDHTDLPGNNNDNNNTPGGLAGAPAGSPLPDVPTPPIYGFGDEGGAGGGAGGGEADANAPTATPNAPDATPDTTPDTTPASTPDAGVGGDTEANAEDRGEEVATERDNADDETAEAATDGERVTPPAPVSDEHAADLEYEPKTPTQLDDEKYPLTTQQQRIADAVVTDRSNTLVKAKAGTGKTSTLEAIAKRLKLTRPNDHVLYVAFNKSVQVEADGRMPDNTESRTGHSLAYQWAGKEFMSKRDGFNRLRRGDEIASFLGITKPMSVGDGPELEPAQVAQAVIRTIDKYSNSADDKIGSEHFPPTLNGISDADKGRVLAYAAKAWKDLSDKDGKINMSFDHVRKMWALSRPDLSKTGSGVEKGAQVLFLDEAQDTPPVLAKVIDDQKMQKVIVGDADQAIYGFTDAIDYLDKAEHDTDLPLTKSWRFGPQIADWGNRFLQVLGSKERVEGGGADSAIVSNMNAPDAVLVRSNGGMIGEIMQELGDGRTVGVPKGTKADLRALVESARYLKGEGDAPERMHEDLAPFRTWAEVEQEARKNADPKLSMLEKMVRENGVDGLDEIVGQIKEMSDTPLENVTFRKTDIGLMAKGRTFDHLAALKQAGFKFREVPGGGLIKTGKNRGQPVKAWFALGDDAAQTAALDRLKEIAGQGPDPDVIISTAHKAKGLEWDRVRIGDDFKGPTTDKATGELIMPSPEELRLAYVAVTRAGKELDLGSLAWVGDHSAPNGEGDRSVNAGETVTPEDRVSVPAEALPTLSDAPATVAPPIDSAEDNHWPQGESVDAGTGVTPEPQTLAPADDNVDTTPAEAEGTSTPNEGTGEVATADIVNQISDAIDAGDTGLIDQLTEELRKRATSDETDEPSATKPEIGADAVGEPDIASEPAAEVPAPEPDAEVTGFVPTGDLMPGDTAQVDGDTADGDATTATGTVLGEPESVTVHSPGTKPKRGTRTTVGEPNGEGDRQTVLSPESSVATHVPGTEGDQTTQAEGSILTGAVGDKVPTDSTGKGAFPGSPVKQGDKTGVIRETSTNGVSVRWDGDDEDVDVQSSTLTVVDPNGDHRPEGWTEAGQRMRPGLVVEAPNGDRGPVDTVDGDHAVVVTNEGFKRLPIGDLKVVGQVKDDDTGTAPTSREPWFDAPSGPEGRDVRPTEPKMPEPLPDGTATGVVNLKPEMLSALNDLGIDTDSTSDIDVQQAANRIRHGMPVSEAQATALANYLRGVMDKMPPAKQRQIKRVVNRLDAAADRIGEGSAGGVPEGTVDTPTPVPLPVGGAEAVSVSDLAVGDVIALPGADGFEVGRITHMGSVTNARGMDMPGTKEVTIETADGRTVTRQLTDGGDVYRLPDLPETDEPVSFGDEPNRPPKEEFVEPAVGDRLNTAADAVVESVLQDAESVESLPALADHIADKADDRIDAPVQGAADSKLDDALADVPDTNNAAATAKKAADILADAMAERAHRSVDEAEPFEGESDKDAVDRWVDYLHDDGANFDFDDAAQDVLDQTDEASETGEPATEPTPEEVEQAKSDTVDALRSDIGSFAERLAALGDVENANTLAQVAARLAGNPDPVHVEAAVQALAMGRPPSKVRSLAARVRAMFARNRRGFVDRLRKIMGTGRKARSSWKAAIAAARNEWTHDPASVDSVAGNAAKHLARGGDSDIVDTDAHTVEPNTSFADRMAEIVGRLPESEGFGQVPAKSPWYRNLGSLAPGARVEASAPEGMTLDRNPDGSPGDTAQGHLRALNQVGDLMDREVTARTRAAAPTLGDDPAATVSEAERHAEDLRAKANGDKALVKEAKRARREAAKMRSDWATARAEAFKSVLEESRSMGPSGNAKVTVKGRGKDSPEVEALEWAQQFMPTDWLTAAGTVEAKAGRQGSYDGDGGITVAPLGDSPIEGAGEYGSSAIRGLSHHMAATVPGLRDAAWVFHWNKTSKNTGGRRTRRGKHALGRMSDMKPGVGFDNTELVRPGDYPFPDMGAGDGETGSAFASVMQGLWAGDPGTEDDDTRRFVLGLLGWLKYEGGQ